MTADKLVRFAGMTRIHALETIRLMARVEEGLEVMQRRMADLQNSLEEVVYPAEWGCVIDDLNRLSNDYDGYRGNYGIEDTRQALIEARNGGVQPFCITIDSEARDYLPHMYGRVNFVLVDDVRKLPLKVSDIYRRLTA